MSRFSSRALLLLVSGIILFGLAACGPASSPDSEQELEITDGDQLDADTEADTDIPDGDTDAEPELEPEVELEPEAEPEPELDLEPEVELEPEAEAETERDAMIPPPSCASPALDTLFDVAPNGYALQFHAAAAFDGQALWVVYNQGTAEGKIRVYLSRLGCDGSELMEPLRLDSSDAQPNNPSLAVNGGVVLVAWEGDDGTESGRMDIYTRAVDAASGEPLAPEAQKLILRKDAQSLDTGAWMTQLAAYGPTDFVLAGAWADARWQAFVVTYSAPDFTYSDITSVSAQPTLTQSYPAVAARADGRLAVAFPEEGDADTDYPSMRLAIREANAASFAPVTTPWETEVAGGAALLYRADGQILYNAVHLVSGEDYAVWLMRADAAGANGTYLKFSPQGVVDHDPVLALGATGGALLWHRITSGYVGDVYVQGFGDSTGSLIAYGEPRKLNAGQTISVYGVSLANLGADHYAAVWVEKAATGKAMALRAKASFIAMTPSAR